MPLSSDAQGRLPLTAAVLSALVLALLALACPVSADTATAALKAPVASAPGESGCGKGAPEDDRGAHPSPPPRSPYPYPYEQAPPECAAHGTGALAVGDGPAPGVLPDRGPPPLPPPTPEELSVLRV
ncbi:hypothetical protein ABT354_34540 [Streptomyces sp. NPDC000594]|uniref:hypothetical protein n=1 Tax=Streptomyces sp. NPDC000594 TaxID=3154261 RepID=UPI003321C548